MIYYTGLMSQMRHTAGAKAPADIMRLCEKRGYQPLLLPEENQKQARLIKQGLKYVRSVLFWESCLKTLKKDDIIVYQHPFYASRLLPKYLDKMQAKGVRFILLIHDLESLRKGIEGAVRTNEKVNNMLEGVLFKKFDAVICHNSKMKAYMISQGYDESKIFELEIFDYLTDCELKTPASKITVPNICIAGNLLKTKSGYIYHVFDEGNKGLKLQLYGNAFDTEFQHDGICYHGSFKPDELPAKLEGNFGLVWDGPSAKTCEGHVGEYLKYNNPHKTSLYLASGIPVVVWSQAAIADFIQKNKVGITVETLSELEEKINSITEEEYLEMCQNTLEIAKKLRNGYYLYQAVDKVLSLF